jgi:hypothetical protein
MLATPHTRVASAQLSAERVHTERCVLASQDPLDRERRLGQPRHPVGLLSSNDIARAGASRSWKDDGLTARNMASTLAAVCGPKSSTVQARA